MKPWIKACLRDRMTAFVVPALGAATLAAAMWSFAPRGATATVRAPTKPSSASLLPAEAARGGWFVVRSDASPDEARVLATWLGSVAEVFLAEAEQLGFAPTIPTAPLEVVFFLDREDFIAFASDVDGINAETMGGYYAPGANRAVIYDDRSTRSFAQAFASSDPHERAAARRDASLATRRKVAHEAAHLLAFNTGVQQRGVAYPQWFTEGFAEHIASLAMGEPRGSEPFQAGWRDALSAGSNEASYAVAHAAFVSLAAKGSGAVAAFEARTREASGVEGLAEVVEPD
ncbi:MAG: DUF1570 domain-containing protein [Phycisphaerales bacterium]